MSRLVIVWTGLVGNTLGLTEIEVFLLMNQLVVLERQWRSSWQISRGVAFFLLLAVSPLLFSQSLLGQSHEQQGLLYGRVETVEDQIWEGVLRWGREEAFWDDLFLSQKKSDPRLFTYLTGDEIRNLEPGSKDDEIDWSFWGLWKPRYPSGQHVFRCRFGDIARLRITGPEQAQLTFRDGSTQAVFGGGSTGKELHIFDEDEVETRVDWDRIKEITFLPTPPFARSDRVRPVYGAVFTPQGAFEGFIHWDDEERLTIDVLEGKNQRGKVSYLFGEIQEIRQLEDSSRITTFDGRTRVLGGSDDFGSGNHDIIVKSLELGHVRIPWDQFRFARFFESPPTFSPGYHDFEEPQRLCATVGLIDGETLSGTIVFDLDERLDLETIEGIKEGIYYHIPIRNIRQMERRNHHVAAITLRNGDQLFLGEEHDLTDANWGLLIWEGDDLPTYVPWREVSTLNF